MASEQENDKSEIVELEVRLERQRLGPGHGDPFQDSSGLAPSSSTPLKDSTPTNQGERREMVGDDMEDCLDVSQDNTIDEERIEVEVGDGSGAESLISIGQQREVKDILESSDC